MDDGGFRFWQWYLKCSKPDFNEGRAVRFLFRILKRSVGMLDSRSGIDQDRLASQADVGNLQRPGSQTRRRTSKYTKSVKRKCRRY